MIAIQRVVDYASSAVHRMPPLPCETSASFRVPCETSASFRVPCETSASFRVPCETSAAFRVPLDRRFAFRVPCETSASFRVPCETSASFRVPLDRRTASRVPCDRRTASLMPCDRKGVILEEGRELTYSVRRVRTRKRTAREALNCEMSSSECPAPDDIDSPLDLSTTGCRRMTPVHVSEVTVLPNAGRPTSPRQGTCAEGDENVLPAVEVTANSIAFKKTLLQRYNASVVTDLPRVTGPPISPVESFHSWNGSVTDEERSSFSSNSTDERSSSSPFAHLNASIDLTGNLFTDDDVDGQINFYQSRLPVHFNHQQPSVNLWHDDINDVRPLNALLQSVNSGTIGTFTSFDSYKMNNGIDGQNSGGSNRSKRAPIVRRLSQNVQSSWTDSLTNVNMCGGSMGDKRPTSYLYPKRTNESVKLKVEQCIEQSLCKRARVEPSMSYLPNETIKPELIYEQKVTTSASNFEEDELDAAAESVDGQTPTFRRRRQGSGTSYLWQFLLELLANSEYCPSCISWVDRSTGTFRLSDTKMVSKLWGLRKNRPAMSYETMGRALRYYYTRGILNRVQGQRLVYQFAKLPVGYSF